MKKNKFVNLGFTLIELLLSISIFAVLLGVTTLNLIPSQRNTNQSSTLEALITDLNQQRIKAMAGDTEGRNLVTNYGIYINNVSYTLFNGTYSNTDSGNFLVNLSSTQHLSTTFPNSQIIFTKGSGEVTCFIDLTCGNTTNTITLIDTTNNQQRVLTINRYGAIIAVN